MKGTVKKIGMYTLVGLVSLTSLVGFDPTPVNAKTIKEKVPVTFSYKMPDTVGEKFGTEPTTYEEVLSNRRLITNTLVKRVGYM